MSDDGAGEFDDDRLSLIAPVGYSASTCGYCTAPGSGQRSKIKSSKSYGIWAHFITPQAYEALLNRGWRRSGHYIYRPDNGNDRTCCPQVAIRLDVQEFKATRQHRRAMRKLQHLVRTPEDSANDSSRIASTSRLPMPLDRFPDKGKYAREWNIEDEWQLVEERRSDGAIEKLSRSDCTPEERHRTLVHYHAERSKQAQAIRRDKGKGKQKTIPPSLAAPCRRLDTTLRLANVTQEKFDLFHKYQSQVHGEKDDKITIKGFERFLCSSPLMSTLPGTTALQRTLSAGQEVDTANDATIPYDLYHMEWRLDGKLIAVGVLDVLPESLSSVYLFYDPGYKDWELGKVSVLREIALVKQLQRKRGMQSLQYYNIGLYIHKTPKMRYKAQYGPAQLLDPRTCSWELLDVVRPALDRGIRFDWRAAMANILPTPTADSSQGVQSNTELPDGDEAAVSGGSESEEEDEDTHMPRPPPPGIDDPDMLSATQLARTYIFDKGQVSLFALSPHAFSNSDVIASVRECVAALGPCAQYFCLVL